MGHSESESGSESGRRERSLKREKPHKKERQRRNSGSEDDERRRKSDSEDERRRKGSAHRRGDDNDSDDGERDHGRRHKHSEDFSEKHGESTHKASGLRGGHEINRPIGSHDEEDQFPRIPRNPAPGPRTGTSGRRIPVQAGESFPEDRAGPAPPFIWENEPTYVGSALLGESSVQPCRITSSKVVVALNGDEFVHRGRYDLLPLTDAMEWVPASSGGAPDGKQVVEGGFENGSPLYHAAARVNGKFIPGKAGPAIGGAQIPVNGTVKFFGENYYVLCWKE